jgi:hypothetical protein
MQRPASPMPSTLGFNCPACGVVLVIQAPDDYDGRPAPCPQCGSHVLPPRVVNLRAEPIDLHPLPGLSEERGFPSKFPRALHRPHGVSLPNGAGNRLDPAGCASPDAAAPAPR